MVTPARSRFVVHICISETTVFLDFQKKQNSIDPVDISDGQTNEHLWQKQTWRGITTSTNGAFGSEAPKMKRRANVENPSATYPSFTSGSGSTLESKTWARHRPTNKSIQAASSKIRIQHHSPSSKNQNRKLHGGQQSPTSVGFEPTCAPIAHDALQGPKAGKQHCLVSSFQYQALTAPAAGRAEP